MTTPGVEHATMVLMRPADVTTLRTRPLVALGVMGATSLYGSARAEQPAEFDTVCIPPGDAGQCPADEDALKQLGANAPAGCVPALGQPGSTLVGGDCCYEVRYDCPPQAAGCS